MFDIKWIRDNPEEFDRGMERRGLEPQAAGLIALDATRREAQTKAQDIQTERNKLSKEIGVATGANHAVAGHGHAVGKLSQHLGKLGLVVLAFLPRKAPPLGVDLEE